MAGLLYILVKHFTFIFQGCDRVSSLSQYFFHNILQENEISLKFLRKCEEIFLYTNEKQY